MSMENIFEFRGSNAWTLRGRRSQGLERPKGSFIGLHGYSEHSARYEHIMQFWLESGYESVWMDLPGHGLSQGKRANIDRFEDYLESFEKFLTTIEKFSMPQPWHFFAHSLGALVGIRFLQTSARAAQFASATLSSPLLGLYKMNGWKLWLVAKLVHFLPNVTMANRYRIGSQLLSHDVEMLKQRNSDPLIVPSYTTHWVREVLRAREDAFSEVDKILVPLAIFQAGEELITNREDTERFYQALSVSQKEWKVYEGFRHEILHEIGRERVMKDILKWVHSVAEESSAVSGST